MNYTEDALADMPNPTGAHEGHLLLGSRLPDQSGHPFTRYQFVQLYFILDIGTSLLYWYEDVQQ